MCPCHFLYGRRFDTIPHPHNFMPLKRAARRTGPASFKRRKFTSRALVVDKSTTVRPRKARTELKRVSTDISTAGTIPQAGTIFTFPRIAAGDENDERDGRAVQIKGYELRSFWQNDPSQDSAPIRIIVFKWTQARTTPVPSDIIDSAAVNPQIMGTYNVNHASNYTILDDKVYEASANSFGNPSLTAWQTRVIPMNSAKNVSFQQTYGDNTLTSVQDNGLYCLVLPFFGNVGLWLAQAAVTFVDI